MRSGTVEAAGLDSERRVRSILARRRVKRVHQSRERDENVIWANALVFYCFVRFGFSSLGWLGFVPVSLILRFLPACSPWGICFWLLTWPVAYSWLLVCFVLLAALLVVRSLTGWGLGGLAWRFAPCLIGGLALLCLLSLLRFQGAGS